jgi:hypothetical protein
MARSRGANAPAAVTRDPMRPATACGLLPPSRAKHMLIESGGVWGVHDA